MKSVVIFILFYLAILCIPCLAYEYSWEINETPQGQESATVVQPIQVMFLDEPVTLLDHSAAIRLQKHYSVHIDADWSVENAHKLLQTFQSIPQDKNSLRKASRNIDDSFWQIEYRHIHNDIEIEYRGDTRIVTIAADAFTNARPLLAKVEGVRGRYFSKRLHRAIVRYVTDNGTQWNAVQKILSTRYGVSIQIPNYTELTKYTTSEDAGRFAEFKSEEYIALINMLEEYPQGMLKTPGLKYLVRRLDGTPHPLYPNAGAVAWTSAGYIEFMETAFSDGNIEATHRLVLHEKAHFLWDHLFDDQLKADWIELGGWYENPDDQDGWSTTKQTEFVSAYAHGKNPNEDMAESISFYIVNPDKLRSRAPAKYEFIQKRIMHGTRYTSLIREDLTFTVYNLYPDYVYPGKIKRIDIKVEGGPKEDKKIKVEIEIHRESELDNVSTAYIRVFSEKGTFFDIAWLSVKERVPNGQILRGHATLSKFAPAGYWSPDSIRLWDEHGNERHGSQSDFGWKLYIDNPLADCEPPEYVPDSMKLSLSEAITSEGNPYHIVTASWEVKEESGIKHVYAVLNDNLRETYSIYRQTEYGRYDIESDRVVVKFTLPEYMPSGVYSLNRIKMLDMALNASNVYFTDAKTDEPPKTIEVITKTPDSEPPVLDVNRITIVAEPTRPEAPNGETIVDISFWIKDNISGYEISSMRLRDPQGIMHFFYHYPNGYSSMYFAGDTTIFKKYHKRIVLPVGSAPGIWGLANMNINDKAGNIGRYDFTEIVRFAVTEVIETRAGPTVKVSLPDKDALLANFPNPFNPETWIPYQLANPADVSISIYAANGKVIRTLKLGNMPAGTYQSRSRAAHWDGKNAVGEPVASGLYFYTLTAGDFTATRKMLIRK